MAITRLEELQTPDQFILKLIYERVKHHPKDGKWRVLKTIFKVKSRDVLVEVDFIFHKGLMSVDNLKLQFPKALIIH